MEKIPLFVFILLLCSVLSHSTPSNDGTVSSAVRNTLKDEKMMVANSHFNVPGKMQYLRTLVGKGLMGASHTYTVAVLPKFCTCKKIGVPKRGCFKIVNPHSHRCERHPCNPKYACVSRGYHRRSSSHKLLRCKKRVLRKEIVLTHRKGYYGEKLFCGVKSVRRVFYFPFKPKPNPKPKRKFKYFYR